MKNIDIIAGTKEAIEYIMDMPSLQVKKILFAMTLLKGDQRLSDSKVPEVRKIAGMYDGYILQEKAAKELATRLAKAYAEKHPNTLLTKKSFAEYTDARYRALREAVGDYGFDYVLEAVKLGRARAADPKNNIDRNGVYKSLKWIERDEKKDVEESNRYHRIEGLKRASLGDMADVLLEHSVIIAHVYDMVEPACKVDLSVEKAPESTTEPEVKLKTPFEMLAHFNEKTGLIKDFYGSKEPGIPEGYTADELAEGSMVLVLADKGLLKDSEAVLTYVERQKAYAMLIARMAEEFTEAELEAIRKHESFITGMFAELANW